MFASSTEHRTNRRTLTVDLGRKRQFISDKNNNIARALTQKNTHEHKNDGQFCAI